ncbi:MAG: phosphoinositide-3-kinase, regulatory subunit 4 [Marteilia pararefringens]
MGNEFSWQASSSPESKIFLQIPEFFKLERILCDSGRFSKSLKVINKFEGLSNSGRNENKSILINAAFEPEEDSKTQQTASPDLRDNFNSFNLSKICPKEIECPKLFVKSVISSNILNSFQNQLISFITFQRSLANIPCCLPLHYYQNDRNPNIISTLRPFVLKSLKECLIQKPVLLMTEKLWLMFQILRVLEFCHKNGIIHGDLKLENILVTSFLNIYVTDFMCHKPETIYDVSDYYFFFSISSPNSSFLAPERILVDKIEKETSESNYSHLSDLFSLGCIFYILLSNDNSTGVFTFKNFTDFAQNRAELPLKSIKDIDLKLDELIKLLTHRDPEVRQQYKGIESEIFPNYFENLFSNGIFNYIASNGDTPSKKLDILLKNQEIFLDLPLSQISNHIVDTSQMCCLLTNILDAISADISTEKGSTDILNLLLLCSQKSSDYVILYRILPIVIDIIKKYRVDISVSLSFLINIMKNISHVESKDVHIISDILFPVLLSLVKVCNYSAFYLSCNIKYLLIEISRMTKVKKSFENFNLLTSLEELLFYLLSNGTYLVQVSFVAESLFSVVELLANSNHTIFTLENLTRRIISKTNSLRHEYILIFLSKIIDRDHHDMADKSQLIKRFSKMLLDGFQSTNLQIQYLSIQCIIKSILIIKDINILDISLLVNEIKSCLLMESRTIQHLMSELFLALKNNPTLYNSSHCWNLGTNILYSIHNPSKWNDKSKSIGFIGQSTQAENWIMEQNDIIQIFDVLSLRYRNELALQYIEIEKKYPMYSSTCRRLRSKNLSSIEERSILSLQKYIIEKYKLGSKIRNEKFDELINDSITINKEKRDEKKIFCKNMMPEYGMKFEKSEKEYKINLDPDIERFDRELVVVNQINVSTSNVYDLKFLDEAETKICAIDSSGIIYLLSIDNDQMNLYDTLYFNDSQAKMINFNQGEIFLGCSNELLIFGLDNDDVPIRKFEETGMIQNILFPSKECTRKDQILLFNSNAMKLIDRRSVSYELKIDINKKHGDLNSGCFIPDDNYAIFSTFKNKIGYVDLRFPAVGKSNSLDQKLELVNFIARISNIKPCPNDHNFILGTNHTHQLHFYDFFEQNIRPLNIVGGKRCNKNIKKFITSMDSNKYIPNNFHISDTSGLFSIYSLDMAKNIIPICHYDHYIPILTALCSDKLSIVSDSAKSILILK